MQRLLRLVQKYKNAAFNRSNFAVTSGCLELAPHVPALKATTGRHVHVSVLESTDDRQSGPEDQQASKNSKQQQYLCFARDGGQGSGERRWRLGRFFFLSFRVLELSRSDGADD